MEDDNDEVVILSDVRPLEPYVVDLSNSSNQSVEEDEREEVLSVADEVLPLAGEEDRRRHMSRGSEVEMEEGGNGQLLGEEERDAADDDQNSSRREEETSLSSMQVEDTNEKHNLNRSNLMLEADAMSMGVADQNLEEEGVEDMEDVEVEPGEESIARNTGAEESPQLELPEIPGAGEADWEIDRDCMEFAENVCRNLENRGEDSEKSEEDLEKSGEDLEKSGEDFEKCGEDLEKCREDLEKSGEGFEKGGEDPEKGGEDLEKSGGDLERGGKDFEKDVEELEPEQGNGEESWQEGAQNSKKKEEHTNKMMGNEEAPDKEETFLDQGQGQGITSGEALEENSDCELEESATGEEMAQGETALIGEKNLMMQHTSGDPLGEQNVIDQHIPTRSPSNALRGDDLLVVEANELHMDHTSDQIEEEFGLGASNKAGQMDQSSTAEERALAEVEKEDENIEITVGKGFVLESKVEELAKELLMEMNMMMQERKEQSKEQVEDQEVKSAEEKEELGEEDCPEDSVKIVGESAEGQKSPGGEEGGMEKEHLMEKNDIKIDSKESSEPKVKLKMVQLDDLLEARQSGGEVNQRDEEEIIDCQADEAEGDEDVNSSNVEDEIIDCLSEDEDMSDLDSDDDDDSDVDIVEVTEDFPDDHEAPLKRENNAECKEHLRGTIKNTSAEGKKILTNEERKENKEDTLKSKSKQYNNQEEGENSDIDTAAWHQKPQLEVVPTSTELEVEGGNIPSPGLRLVPWLDQAENIPGLAPKKTSSHMKSAKVVMEKLKTLSKSVKRSTKQIMLDVRQGQSKKVSKTGKKEEKNLTKPENSVSKPAVNIKALVLSETKKQVKKIKKSSKKLSEGTKRKEAKYASKSKEGTLGVELKKSKKDESKRREDIEEGKKSKVKKLSSTFKIPRGNYQSQRIHTTGDNRVDTFLAEEQISINLDLSTFLKDEAGFRKMFEAVEKLPTGKKGAKKRVKELSKSESRQEMEDLASEGWEEVRKLSCDKERVKKAQEEFGNPVPSDPFRNLTVHGFKGRSKANARKRKWCEANLPFCSHPEEETSCKRIRHEDFSKVMKTVFFHRFNKSRSSLKSATEEQVTNCAFASFSYLNFQVQNHIEDFKTYISHYKAAQEETANFLSYYDTKVYSFLIPPST